MKKILAMLAALTMSTLILAACGDTDSSGSESAASKGSDDAAPEEVVYENLGPLGNAYNNKVAAGKLQMEAKIDMTGDQPIVLEKNGDDIHMQMSFFGMNLNIYQVDGKAYQLIPAAEMYAVVPPDQISAYTDTDYAEGLDDSYTFVESYEEDGFTVEKYTVKEDLVISVAEGVSYEMDETAQESTAYLYFDADGNLKKQKVEGAMSTEVEFTKLEFEDVPVELPDISSWMEVTEDSELSPADEVRMNAGMMGITKDMIEAAGYTYESLAEMDEDAQSEALQKIAEDNGITIGFGF